VVAGKWAESNGNIGSGGSTSFTVDTVTPTVPRVNLDVATQATLTANAAHGVLASASAPGASLPLAVTAVGGVAADVGQAIATADGTLTLNADGSYSYTETANSSSLVDGAAVDNISFTATDINGNGVTANLSILVYNPGDPLYVGSAGSPITVGNASSVVDGRAGTETIKVGNGNDAVFAGTHDAITVGSGQDQLVAGFDANWTLGTGQDTLAFNSSGFGSNTVSGFNTSQDILKFNPTLFQNYAAVLAATTQVGSNAVITDPQGDQVTLVNVTATHLTANNIKIG
jgi:VCBS repeat-containing protein